MYIKYLLFNPLFNTKLLESISYLHTQIELVFCIKKSKCSNCDYCYMFTRYAKNYQNDNLRDRESCVYRVYNRDSTRKNGFC